MLHGKRREEEPGTKPHRNQHAPYYAQQRYLCFLDYGCVRYVFGLSDHCSQSAPVPNSSSIDGTPAQCGWLVCLLVYSVGTLNGCYQSLENLLLTLAETITTVGHLRSGALKLKGENMVGKAVFISGRSFEKCWYVLCGR